MNLFKALVATLPTYPLRAGVVVSVEDSGLAAIVELPGGGQVRVRTAEPTTVIGDRVYIRNGVIEGPAPNKPTVTGAV